MRKKKTTLNGLRRIISAALTFVMIFTLIPAAFAEEGENATGSGIALTDPTPERIFCVVNDLTADMNGLLGTEYVLEYLIIEGTEGMKLSQLVNEDGTFTEYSKNLLTTLVNEVEAEMGLEIGSVEIPDDIYTLIHIVIVDMYESANEDPDMIADSEFFKDFPTADALEEYIFTNYFGGNSRPSVEELIEFAVGNLISIDSEGYIRLVYSDYVYDDEGFSLMIDEVIAPSGAYLKPLEQFGSYRNVYAQLKDKWDAGEISNEEALAILTGYAADPYGDLYTVSPIVEYLYDIDGKRVNAYTFEPEIFLNDDLTVADTGLSARDYTVQALTKMYESMNNIGEYIGIESGLIDFALKYFMLFEPIEDCAAAAAEEVDEMIQMYKDEGYSDAEIAAVLLSWAFYINGTDSFGYLVTNSTSGYAKNSAGERINISEIMDKDGKFITDEFGAESVAELFEEYLKDMSTEAVLKGDVNDDGKVNLADVSLVLKKIAGWNVEMDDIASDVNGDGLVNIRDASLMLKSIADWDVSFIY